MSAAPTPEPELITARIALTIAGTKLEANVTVPTAPARLSAMLPLLQGITDAVIASVVKSVEAQGRKISCKAGCAACCRQMVPVSEVEARRLREVVEGLAEPARSRVKGRFQDALGRLEQAGLLDALRRFDRLSTEERNQAGRTYFAQYVACPFLEDESCSIYHDRPVGCRQYLVTSPPALCSNPMDNALGGVAMPVPLWPILARIGEDPAEPEPGPLRWLPLVLAPEWADAHPDETAARPAPEWVRLFFERLCGTPIPAPEVGVMAAPIAPGE